MAELYSKLYRLEEVIMLIQLFGLGDFQRGEKTLARELEEPRSNPGGTWTDLVKQHPGFFRVTGKVEGEEMMSLAIRYIDSPSHSPLNLSMVELLMKQAVNLHEAEVKRLERRRILLAALIAGFSAIIANLIAAVLKPK